MEIDRNLEDSAHLTKIIGQNCRNNLNITITIVKVIKVKNLFIDIDLCNS